MVLTEIAKLAYIEKCYDNGLITDYERQQWLTETLELWYSQHPNHTHN